MNIKVVVVGELATNCYILEKNNKVLIIDPGAEKNLIAASIPEDKEVIGIILTHSHDDHTGAVKYLSEKYNTPCYDFFNLSEGVTNISEFSFEVIKTPGHLNDCITLYFVEEKVMFVGDFIFKDSIGRTDLKGANPEEMKQSIMKILKYPFDIKIYPGHFQPTTLGAEVNNLNYFLKIL